jgi:hypothetical protein
MLLLIMKLGKIFFKIMREMQKKIFVKKSSQIIFSSREHILVTFIVSFSSKLLNSKK